jgi:hypothetical protein
MKNTLAKKILEVNALHEAILDEQNHLIEENIKLTEELSRLKEESTRAIATKDKVNLT